MSEKKMTTSTTTTTTPVPSKKRASRGSLLSASVQKPDTSTGTGTTTTPAGDSTDHDHKNPLTQRHKNKSSSNNNVVASNISKKAKLYEQELNEEQKLASLLFGTTTATSTPFPITTTTLVTTAAVTNDDNHDDVIKNSTIKKLQKKNKKKKQKTGVTSGNENELNSNDLSDSITFEIDRVGTTTTTTTHDDANDGDTDHDNDDTDEDKNKVVTNDNGNEDDDDNDDDSNGGKPENGLVTGTDDVIEAETILNPAWYDSDDDKLPMFHLNNNPNHVRLKNLRTSRMENTIPTGSEIQNRLRQHYQKTVQSTISTTWAIGSTSSSTNDISESLTTTTTTNANLMEEDPELQEFLSASTPLLLSSSTSLLSKKTKNKVLENESSLSLTKSISNHPSSLKPHQMDIIRCPNANHIEPNVSCVTAVQFYQHSDPLRPLLVTGGLDKTLRFFQCTTEQSTKVHGVHFPKLPIYHTSFLGKTGKVLVTGRRPFYYVYDANVGQFEYIPKLGNGMGIGNQQQRMGGGGGGEKTLENCTVSSCGQYIAFTGKDGYIHIVESRTNMFLYSLKINGNVTAITFGGTSQNGGDDTTNNNDDAIELYASGTDGDVYVFDIRTRQCIERFSNQDGTITTSIAYSPTSRHYAVGSKSGVVNLYPTTTRNVSSSLSSSSIYPPMDDTMANSSQIVQSYHDEQQQQQQLQQPFFQPSRSPLKSIMNLKTGVDTLRFNHDGQLLLLSSKYDRKNALRLVHVPSQTVYSNWPTNQTPLQHVQCADFSPQSKFLVMGNDRGHCLLYNLKHYN